MTGMDGDGTVPRLSATPIERSQVKVERIVACPHAGLPNFQPVPVQGRSALDDGEISESKTSGVEAISLKMADVFSTREPFKLSHAVQKLLILCRQHWKISKPVRRLNGSSR
jgi:hypothetical protein